MTSGLEGETAIAPTGPTLIWPSVIGSQYWPASSVFQTPPEECAWKKTFRSVGCTATLQPRFPTWGPTQRHSIAERSASCACGWVSREREASAVAPQRMRRRNIKISLERWSDRRARHAGRASPGAEGRWRDRFSSAFLLWTARHPSGWSARRASRPRTASVSGQEALGEDRSLPRRRRCQGG